MEDLLYGAAVRRVAGSAEYRIVLGVVARELRESPCVGGADAGGEPGLGNDGLPDAPCRGSGGISLSWENGEGLVDGVFLDVRGEAHEDLHHAV